MGEAIIARRGGAGGTDIENSKIENMKALESIKANNFVQKEADASIVQAESLFRKYKFPGTNYKLIEPRQRTNFYGLAENEKEGNVPIQVEHPDGTIKTVISINSKMDTVGSGFTNYLTQVIPVSANSFIAVYCWSDNIATEGSYNIYYVANRHITIAVYELDETMSTATLALPLSELPFVGATDTQDTQTYIRSYLPYSGMAITAVFPTKFDKCFVLCVYRVSSWISNKPASPKYCGTFVYCDYSRGTMVMTQKDLGQMAVFADLNENDVNTVKKYGGDVLITKTLYQPYAEDGVYEQVITKEIVDSDQTEYTKGVYFFRFDILDSSKNITLYPATFIKSLEINSSINSLDVYRLAESSVNSDGSKTLCYLSLPNLNIIKNRGQNKIVVKLNPDGYVDEASLEHLSIVVPRIGLYGNQTFEVNDTGSYSNSVNIDILTVINGQILGVLKHTDNSNYSNTVKGILPIYWASFNKNQDVIQYHLKGLDTLPSYASEINSFTGDLYNFIPDSLEEIILGARYNMSTNYLVELKNFVLGVIPSKSSIDGISKESSEPGKFVEISVLKE